MQGRTETLTAAIEFLEPLNSDLTCSCPLMVNSHQGTGRWGIEDPVLLLVFSCERPISTGAGVICLN